MLFGSGPFLERITEIIQETEHRYGFQVIFASTIGSISRGISNYNSDYDIRLLFVYPHETLSCDMLHQEDYIRHRVFCSKVPYNCLAFWEAHAFVNFMREPYITKGFQYKLVRNVLWSFLSPYTHDPKGIGAKILPLIEDMADLTWEKSYFSQIVLDALQGDNLLFTLTEYLNIWHAYLSFQWIVTRRQLAPLSIDSLLALASPRDRFKIQSALQQSRCIKNEPLSHSRIFTLDFSSDAVSAMKKSSIPASPYRNQRDHIQTLFGILDDALRNTPIVRDVTD